LGIISGNARSKLTKKSKRKTFKTKSSHGKSDVLNHRSNEEPRQERKSGDDLFLAAPEKNVPERNDKKQSGKAQVRKSS
jgi:hypothetical protein